MATMAGSCFAAIFAYNSNDQLSLKALGLKLVVGAWKFDAVTAKLISFCCDHLGPKAK